MFRQITVKILFMFSVCRIETWISSLLSLEISQWNMLWICRHFIFYKVFCMPVSQARTCHLLLEHSIFICSIAVWSCWLSFSAIPSISDYWFGTGMSGPEKYQEGMFRRFAAYHRAIDFLLLKAAKCNRFFFFNLRYKRKPQYWNTVR